MPRQNPQRTPERCVAWPKKRLGPDGIPWQDSWLGHQGLQQMTAKCSACQGLAISRVYVHLARAIDAIWLYEHTQHLIMTSPIRIPALGTSQAFRKVWTTLSISWSFLVNHSWGISWSSKVGTNQYWLLPYSILYSTSGGRDHPIIHWDGRFFQIFNDARMRTSYFPLGSSCLAFREDVELLLGFVQVFNDV